MLIKGSENKHAKSNLIDVRCVVKDRALNSRESNAKATTGKYYPIVLNTEPPLEERHALQHDFG